MSDSASRDASECTVEHTCGVCGALFPSKNKLFKHLKCGGDCAKLSGHAIPAHLLPAEPSAEELEGTYVYVVGGRERGHTLGRLYLQLQAHATPLRCIG